MSSLTGAEKKCLEAVFGMNSGFVLDFSDQGFAEFFDSHGVDIHGSQYHDRGNSKANKLRAFWDKEPDELVGKVLSDLLNVCEILGRDQVAIEKGRAIAAKLSEISLEYAANAQALSSEAEVIKLSQKWYKGGQLDEGGFGQVFQGQSEAGEEAVIKLIQNVPGADRELLFRNLDGVPNVVPTLDRGEWGDFLVLVMPRADKSLRHHLSQNGDRLSVDETVEVLSDVAHALAGIEGQVVHRDIKPENILRLNGRWCLADFGVSRYADATTAIHTHKDSMTPRYAAPEQWRSERATPATDVYSLGVVAYELLAGEAPFSGPEEHDYKKQHLFESPEAVSGVPSRLLSLINECLSKSPDLRPVPQVLVSRLNDCKNIASGAGIRLQQANDLEVQRRNEAARKDSVAAADSERRGEYSREANRILKSLVASLHERILSDAPVTLANPPAGIRPNWSWALGQASMRVLVPSTWLTDQPPDDTHPLPFEVIVHSSIALKVKPDRDGYEGRSHSLWFCDAQEAGVFRWYETAFMVSPAVPRKDMRIAPFALEPGRKACIALSPGIAHDQVAWPFTPIDRGEEERFIERWVEWFAMAALGQLSRPIKWPEREAKGSWRRGV